MRFLIVAQGSFGDLNPSMGIGLALKKRGHEVTFLTSGFYQQALERLGLDLAPTVSREDHLRITAHPDASHPFKSLRYVMREWLVGPMRREYAAIRDASQPGRTTVLMLGPGIGARIAQEKLGVPVITLLLYPQLLRSVYDPHGFGGGRLLPTMARKWIRAAFDRRIDAIVGPETNRFRNELGLASIPRNFNDWAYSPELIVGLFPEWYATPQPDWPPIRQAGFPVFDGDPAAALAPEVEEFLVSGEPPVIVNALSGTRKARGFFESSIAALARLGRRGILLSPYAENVPPNLPEGIRYFGYVPHTLLMPRVAAIVHQGGVGTMAKALLAGIPQIIVPVTYDQPYNGSHVTEMDAGAMIRPRNYDAGTVARKLDSLLNSAAVKESLKQVQLKMRGEDGIGNTCHLIEAACDSRRAVAAGSAG